MFSTMITDESTMMPKSTAPIDSRLADFAAHVEHREREQQRQRDIDRNDDRRADVVHEHEQDDDDQHHAHQQVFGHGVGGDVEQLGPVVIALDLCAREHSAALGIVELGDLGLDVLECRQRLFVLSQQDDAFDDVRLVVAVPSARQSCASNPEARSRRASKYATRAQPRRWLTTTPCLPRSPSGRAAPFHDVFDADGLVVDGRDDQRADIADAPHLLRPQNR